jgi:ATP-binding cassette subfamily B (MDR/TAP) protein 1
MSLIFGRLTQDYINFQITRVTAESGDPNGIAALPAAAERFRRSAALDASYLVYIGISLPLIDLLVKPQ